MSHLRNALKETFIEMNLPFRHQCGDILEVHSFESCRMGGAKSRHPGRIRSPLYTYSIHILRLNRTHLVYQQEGQKCKGETACRDIVSILGVQGVGKSTGTHAERVRVRVRIRVGVRARVRARARDRTQV